MVFLYILAGLLGLLLLYILFLAVCTLLVNPDKEYETYSTFYHYALKTVANLMIFLVRIKIHITGAEKLPKEEKLLFVCNHRSSFDPIVTWYTFHKWKLGFISKASNFKIPFLGRMIRKCCFMPIDRENPRNAIVTINKAAGILRSKQASIGVYPEGTRSKECVLLPFHNGVFKIAQKANASIAVLSVVGTESIHKQTPWKRSHVYLDILEIIPAEEVKATKTEIIGEKVRSLIENNIEKREA